MFSDEEYYRRYQIIRTSNTMKEAARRLGISYSCAVHWAKKNKVRAKTMCKKGCDHKKDSERMALYLQGKTDKEIAEAIGSSVNTVSKWRVRKNLGPNIPERKVSPRKIPKIKKPIKVVERKAKPKPKPKHFPPDIRQRLGYYAMIL